MQGEQISQMDVGRIVMGLNESIQALRKTAGLVDRHTDDPDVYDPAHTELAAQVTALESLRDRVEAASAIYLDNEP